VSKQLIGVIGGTGLGAKLSAAEGAERLHLDTPFGAPSGPLLKSRWGEADVVFLNRHGVGHTHSPSTVPYRANIFAMKQLGVTHIIASGAVGSLREEIAPGHLVICDQVIDKTHRRAGTFFDDGMAVHVELADPFCDKLRHVLLSCAEEVDTTVHGKGTYVVMEGPQFSTRAESNLHRQWGADLIGMTCMPEARLAREAEICYALVALPTDYDCWRPHDPARSKTALLTEIIGNLNRATEHAVNLIAAAVRRLSANPLGACPCGSALELGIWSDKSKVRPELVRKLRPLIGRHFEQSGI
jgi:5'-methylthioadenosine phosphorylase